MTYARRKIMLSRRNFALDSKAIFSPSIGVWEPNYPLANLQDPNPQEFAQVVSNLDINSTKFYLDLGQQRTVGLFFFANLRATSLGVMRIEASLNSDLSSPTYDSGMVTCWPKDTDDGTNDVWGEWKLSGTYSSEEYMNLNMLRIFLMDPSAILCRYILCSFRDVCAVLPLKIGCFGACEVFESPNDFGPAPQITVLDDSEVLRIPSGNTFINQQHVRRRFNFTFPAFDKDDDVMTKTLGMALIKGKTEPLVAISYPEDVKNLEKNSVYGTVSSEIQLNNSFFKHYSQPIQIDEWV